MTNNDADQLYNRPTFIQLKQTDKGCTDIWEVYGLRRVQMLGVHMDVWVVWM